MGKSGDIVFSDARKLRSIRSDGTIKWEHEYSDYVTTFRQLDGDKIWFTIGTKIHFLDGNSGDEIEMLDLPTSHRNTIKRIYDGRLIEFRGEKPGFLMIDVK